MRLPVFVYNEKEAPPMTENPTYAGVINVGENRYVGSFGSLQPGDAIILERPRAVVVVHHNAPELELFTLTDEEVGNVTVNEPFNYANVFGEAYESKNVAETIKIDEIDETADAKGPAEEVATVEATASGTEGETVQSVVTDPAPVVADPVTPTPADETVVTTPVVAEATDVVATAPVIADENAVAAPVVGDETVVTPAMADDTTVVNPAPVQDDAVVTPAVTEDAEGPKRRPRTNTNQ
jgi:hypothetical protein